MKIAKTSLGSKILSQHSEHFANLAVEAVLRLGQQSSLDSIQVIKKLGGSMEDSYLEEGFLLEKKPGMYQPQRIEDAKILIANTPMDTDKVKYPPIPTIPPILLFLDNLPILRSKFLAVALK